MSSGLKVSNIDLDELIENFGTTNYSDLSMASLPNTYSYSSSRLTFYGRRYENNFNKVSNRITYFSSGNFKNQNNNIFIPELFLAKGCGPLGTTNKTGMTFYNTFTGTIQVWYINSSGKSNAGRVYVGSSTPTSSSGVSIQDLFFISLTMPGGNGGKGQSQAWPAQGNFGGGGGGAGGTLIVKASPPSGVVSNWISLMRVVISYDSGSDRTYADIYDNANKNIGRVYSGGDGGDANAYVTGNHVGTGGVGGTCVNININGAAHLFPAIFTDSNGTTSITSINGTNGNSGNAALSTEGDFFTVPNADSQATNPYRAYSSSRTLLQPVGNTGGNRSVRIKSISEYTRITVPGGCGGNSFWGVGGDCIRYSNAGYYYAELNQVYVPGFGGGGFGGAARGGGSWDTPSGIGQTGATGYLQIRV